MARTTNRSTNKKTKAAKRTTPKASESKVTVDRGESKRSTKDTNFMDRIQNDLEKNQSYLNLILGALIVIVLGVLIFNYFNKPAEETGNITPQAETAMDENGDVTKEGLPGKYTVKEGDTLFLIAQKYYDDGNKYTEIMKDNGLTSESIEVGQELNIPKPESESMAQASTSPSPDASPSEEAMAEASPSPEASASPEVMAQVSPSTAPAATADPNEKGGTGGASNQTIWGESITSDTYTVTQGDWLSKIAGRAYGDIYKYEIIAKANNITDPDNIEVGTVLKIPRD